MKKQIQIIAISLLTAFSSCTTSGSGSGTSTTPASSLTVNFQGNTYTSSTVNASSTQATSVGTAVGWLATVTGGDTKTVSIMLTQMMNYNIVNGIGTYKIGGTTNGVNFSGGQCSILDYTHGNATYISDASDTTSTVTVTVSNSTECKGTFNVRLNNGSGTYSMATGTFDYRH